MNVVHGRPEARLAAAVGPGTGILPGQRVVGAFQRQLFERGSCLGGQQVSQRVVGQVRRLQRNGHSTQVAHRVQPHYVELIGEIGWATCRAAAADLGSQTDNVGELIPQSRCNPSQVCVVGQHDHLQFMAEFAQGLQRRGCPCVIEGLEDVVGDERQGGR